MYDEPRFLLAGDAAIVVEFGESISPDINHRVHSLMSAIDDRDAPEIVDIVPSYRSLLVHYDPTQISLDDLTTWLFELASTLEESEVPASKVIQIPTLYGGEYGPDLEYVAEYASLEIEKVIALHSSTDYMVYMMGFTPGFPYLGILPMDLATPRFDTPRSNIPAGSVGIAEYQTGIYPVASPGGWRVIGRTPLTLFEPLRNPPSLLSAGDYVNFVPMSGKDEYLQIQEDVQTGTYRVRMDAAS